MKFEMIPLINAYDIPDEFWEHLNACDMYAHEASYVVNATYFPELYQWLTEEQHIPVDTWIAIID